jgi:GntR family transcriptional regulator of arabinose operon
MKKDDFWDFINIDKNKSVPKYRQLQSEIERLIAENVLKVDTRLPGENEFFNKLGLSRTTIRDALRSLEEAHLIYRVQGNGTFIGSKPASLSKDRDSAKAGNSKQVIGVVLPNITNEIYPFIISGIEQTVSSRHICVFSANSGGSWERELRIINEMNNNSVSGLILEPIYSGANGSEERLVSLLEMLSIPVVIINNDIPAFNCSKVMQDDSEGGRLATEHLLEYGHKRIAYIYNDRIGAALERRRGYRAALEAAGIAHDPELEISYNNEQGLVYPGYIFTKELLEKPDLRVTAIFYFNDDLALQGLAAVQSLNLEIPRDLSIVGFDDIPRSRLSGIQLTTVSHPKALLGTLAASLLLEQFERFNTPAMYRKICVQSPLVFRGSVAAPSLRQ